MCDTTRNSHAASESDLLTRRDSLVLLIYACSNNVSICNFGLIKCRSHFVRNTKINKNGGNAKRIFECGEASRSIY